MPSATGDSAASSSARHLEDTSDNADLGFAEEGPKETVKKCKKTLNKITAPFYETMVDGIIHDGILMGQGWDISRLVSRCLLRVG